MPDLAVVLAAAGRQCQERLAAGSYRRIWPGSQATEYT